MMNNLARRSLATTRPTLARSISNQAKKEGAVALANRHDALLAGFDDFFGPTFLTRRGSPFNDPFFTTDLLPVRLASPGYNINEKDGEYQISVDLPGVTKNDMTVTLENEGKVLQIAGGRKTEKEGIMTETKFEKHFTIGSNIDTQKITANLNDGVLVLTAPEKENVENPAHTIAITEGPLPVLEKEGPTPGTEEEVSSMALEDKEENSTAPTPEEERAA